MRTENEKENRSLLQMWIFCFLDPAIGNAAGVFQSSVLAHHSIVPTNQRGASSDLKLDSFLARWHQSCSPGVELCFLTSLSPFVIETPLSWILKRRWKNVRFIRLFFYYFSATGHTTTSLIIRLAFWYTFLWWGNFRYLKICMECNTFWNAFSDFKKWSTCAYSRVLFMFLNSNWDFSMVAFNLSMDIL